MKRLSIFLLYVLLAVKCSSQADSSKQNKRFSLGAQINGQLASAIEQNWIRDNSYNSFIPLYSFGIYIKKQKHTFDFNLSNTSFTSANIVPFVSYYYKFNKRKSTIDLNASARLYSYFQKHPGSADIKNYNYSYNAFCYGLSLDHSKNRFTASIALYNYLTFSSYNKIYKNRDYTLPILYGTELSADMLVELKLMYRITKQST
ncbi:MAG: hypothetical protein H0X46_09585 [Bacteroidetes bacterium]|nr:hypothetical protein [Bacteroidota bacterium]